MRTAVYPGSFDPVTLGHLDIIRRAAAQFDRVVVCSLINSRKTTLFSLEERLDFLRRVTASLPNVEVKAFDGLLAAFARAENATVLIKGLRTSADYEDEFQMATINRQLNPELDTLFFPAKAEYLHVSSTAAKEMARYGADLTGYVPQEIIPDLTAKLKPGR